MNNFPDLTAYGYKIEKQLGQNFQGGRVTYLAQDLAGDRPVVLKQFGFGQGAENWSGYNSLEAEISVLQRLSHPQIPHFITSFTTDNGFYLVTEYIDAPTLAQTKRLTFREIKDITIQLLDILQNLQQQQPPVIHRDIKPENILLRRQGQAWQVFLIDFGFARLFEGDLSASSTVKGTLGFMPPEQIFQRELTTASDLYSLGVTLIAVLCGKPSEAVGELIGSDYRIKFRPHLHHLPSFFLSWLEKLTEPDLDKRYLDANNALQALLKLEKRAIKPLPTTTSELQLATSTKLKIFGVLIVFLGWTAWRSPEPPTPVLPVNSSPATELLPIVPPDVELPTVPAAEPLLNQRAIDELFFQAEKAYDYDSFDEASYYYDLVLDLDPNHVPALSGKCASFYYINFHEEALTACEKAIALDSEDYRLYNRHGLVLTGGFGRHEEALVSFERSQELKPSYFWAWVNHSRALTSLGRYEEAIASADKGIELRPDKSGGYVEKCKAYRGLGELETALDLCNQAIAADPESELSHDVRGRILYDQGQYRQALASFQTATTINPNREWSWYRLGLTLDALGEKQQAIAAYRRALEIQPSFIEAHDKLQAWQR